MFLTKQGRSDDTIPAIDSLTLTTITLAYLRDGGCKAFASETHKLWIDNICLWLDCSLMRLANGRSKDATNNWYRLVATKEQCFNSLELGTYGCNFKCSVIKIMSNSCEFALKWMPQNSWCYISIGLDNGLLPLGTPEAMTMPMLTTICYQTASLCPQCVNWYYIRIMSNQSLICCSVFIKQNVS